MFFHFSVVQAHQLHTDFFFHAVPSWPQTYIINDRSRDLTHKGRILTTRGYNYQDASVVSLITTYPAPCLLIPEDPNHHKSGGCTQDSPFLCPRLPRSPLKHDNYQILCLL